MNTGNWLSEFGKNIFSQYGEDGIIEKIFQIVPHSSWCVEFGAWDGAHLSNTANLLQHKNWSGVLIEGDAQRFGQLCRNYSGKPGVHCVHAWVSLDGTSSLGQILATTPIPRDFDLLSIDIDGSDYHVWKSLENFRPKVVVIEFNNTIPNAVEYIQKADFNVHQGSSLKAFCGLASQKGYELIGVTDFNAFFVDKKFYPLFEMKENSPEIINREQKYLTHVFQLMDGTLCYEGNKTLLWFNVDAPFENLQALPGIFRFFPTSDRARWKIYFVRAYVFLSRYVQLSSLVLMCVATFFMAGLFPRRPRKNDRTSA